MFWLRNSPPEIRAEQPKLRVVVHGNVQRFVAMHAKVFGVVRAETGAGVQAQVRVGARFDESKCTLVMAALGGEEKRCCSGPVANVQVRSSIDQHAIVNWPFCAALDSARAF